MTTAEQFRSAAPSRTPLAQREVLIAGVPWPAYKVVALIVGALVLAGVGVVTGNPSAAVLIATAVATAVWWILRAGHRRH
ncbi:hypothetical protein [[Mycobacterium] wendilense]|uniref:Uncharacterized protein n=1 Tax=[Mycobacterium] wendilense TaxID=3064284 RepID=A0ABN9NZ76_9MYCO|nr:hypothetical protein [Mycolicibacterium sp. MU0050]CAJ1583177.1 hypothetical protein MU0050_002474 [Mycolicibacterium sp. MU0050]